MITNIAEPAAQRTVTKLAGAPTARAVWSSDNELKLLHALLMLKSMRQALQYGPSSYIEC